MRVLMLGWEYPPYISGGLGTACQGLSEGLGALGTQVAFVVPYPVRTKTAANVQLVGTPAGKTVALAANPSSRPEASIQPASAYARPVLSRTPRAPHPEPAVAPSPADRGAGEPSAPAPSPDDSSAAAEPFPDTALYAGDLFEQTERYADLAEAVAAEERFDVVHAHDWMTFRAGIRVARRLGKPLVVHVHSPEFDRNGDHVHQPIYNIERMGMHAADRVLTVSGYTRQMCLARYGVPVLMSKQSGVAETVRHALKVDFWDVDKMADRILAVLRRPALSDCLHTNGLEEAERFRWTDAARRCLGVYADVCLRQQPPTPAA